MRRGTLLSSPETPTLRRLRRLSEEPDTGLVFLEGPRVIREAVGAGIRLDLLALGEDDAFEAPAAELVRLGGRALRSVSRTVTPRGPLAIGRAGPVSLPAALGAARARGWPLIVLDGVQDPGNVGGIARSLAAAGGPALAVLPGTADPFGPKAVRGSAGHLFRLRVARATWPDLEGLRLVGMSAAGGRPLAEADLNVEVLVLGAEARGLSRPDLELVSIPMEVGVESLNVAAAAAVALFEIRRRLSG